MLQKEGECVFVYYVFISFRFLTRPVAQQNLCSRQSTFICWASHFHPFFTSCLSLLCLPPLVIQRCTSKHRVSRDQSWIDTSASFCRALYNESYITCLLTAVTVCHFSCSEHKQGVNFKKKSRFKSSREELVLRFSAAHDETAHTRL